MYERYREGVCYLCIGFNVKVFLKIWKSEFLIGLGFVLFFKRFLDDRMNVF